MSCILVCLAKICNSFFQQHKQFLLRITTEPVHAGFFGFRCLPHALERQAREVAYAGKGENPLPAKPVQSIFWNKKRTKRTRRKFSAAFKTQGGFVATSRTRHRRRRSGARPSEPIAAWKRQLSEGAPAVFDPSSRPEIRGCAASAACQDRAIDAGECL